MDVCIETDSGIKVVFRGIHEKAIFFSIKPVRVGSIDHNIPTFQALGFSQSLNQLNLFSRASYMPARVSLR